MSIEDHLNELLDQKNKKIDELEEELYRLEEENRLIKYRDWFMHKTDKAEQTLPVPRLEIKVIQNPNDKYEREWFYNLVYKHFLDEIRVVPLGHTRVSGGMFDPEDLSINDLPIRDGAHIKHDMKELKLPAFIVSEQTVIEIK